MGIIDNRREEVDSLDNSNFVTYLVDCSIIADIQPNEDLGMSARAEKTP